MPQTDTTSALSKHWLVLHLVIAFISGALCHLSFAPYDIQIIAPLSIAVLYVQLTFVKPLTAKAHVYLGLAYGFGLFITGLRWVHVSLDTFGGLPLIVTLGLMVLLSLYLALFPAAVAYVFAKLKHHSAVFNALVFAALWTLCEYLRGEMLTGFPWLLIGYSQTLGVFSQLASIIGVLGLSFVIVLLAALCINLIKGSKASAVLLIIGLALSTWLSTITSVKPNGKTTELALIQGNIEQSAKWQQEAMWPTISRYMKLTREHFDADLIIWPEAAMPAVEAWVEDYLHGIDQEALRHNSAIVTGIIARSATVEDNEVSQDYYNALITLGQHDNTAHQEARYSDEHSNRYYKHQLLPIGEFVPFAQLLRPLAPLFNLPMSSFTRGDAVQPNLSAKGIQLTAAICYEIAFSQLVRQNLTPITDMILTVSNDAWFGRSIGPHQHMQIAQMRAIELGRPVIRVTNTGVTAIVNPQGQITDQLDQFEEGVLRATVASYQGVTYYYRLGHAPILWLSALLVAFGFILKRYKR